MRASLIRMWILMCATSAGAFFLAGCGSTDSEDVSSFIHDFVLNALAASVL